MVDNKLSEFRSIGKEEFGVESYDQYPGDFFRRIVTSECAAFAELADVAVCALPNRTVSWTRHDMTCHGMRPAKQDGVRALLS